MAFLARTGNAVFSRLPASYCQMSRSFGQLLSIYKGSASSPQARDCFACSRAITFFNKKPSFGCALFGRLLSVITKSLAFPSRKRLALARILTVRKVFLKPSPKVLAFTRVKVNPVSVWQQVAKEVSESPERWISLSGLNPIPVTGLQ